MLRKALVAVVVSCGWVFGCGAAEGDGDEAETEPTQSAESELQSSVSCSTETMTAYSGGSSIGTVDVIRVGGKRVTKKTAHAFLKWQKAAAAAGVDIAINSGFRTMDEQRYFWNCYQSGNCNNGNLAARPGYSNHQNGRALDISNSTSSWVIQNAARFGFRRTVPAESWHYEYFGEDPGGPCSGGGGTAGSSTDSCRSATLGRDVTHNTCVQARSDSLWYRCSDGSWLSTTSQDSACTAKHPL
jgi:hypothetical protein